MTDWQPISTAPKDGTTVMLTGSYWVVAGWFSHSDFLGPDAKLGAWVDGDPRHDGRALKGDHAPTHWMPLPEPPAYSSTGASPSRTR